MELLRWSKNSQKTYENQNFEQVGAELDKFMPKKRKSIPSAPQPTATTIIVTTVNLLAALIRLAAALLD